MSYGFKVTAGSKAEAKAQIERELDTVVAGQSVHEADRAGAQAAAESFVDLLTDPADGEQVTVNVSGYLSWREEGVFTAARVEVVATIEAAPAQEA